MSRPNHPQLNALIPSSVTPPARTASSTPMTSPGLFSPTNARTRTTFPGHSVSDSNTPIAYESGSPYLHPLQNHKVRETHKAYLDSDSITGRKLINQYEVIEEIGRGMHGKVKLARNLETGDNVAIKIIPRYSKKRRLGKVMALSPQDKTMREIAILKKMRHPNVVSLLEIIDDPELRKIYLILEHVELGEVVWRKKGIPHICAFERRRIEREARGETTTAEEEQYEAMMERRSAVKELKRAKMSQAHAGPHDHWSIEHGLDDSSYSSSRIPSIDDLAVIDRSDGEASHPGSMRASRPSSVAPSRSTSVRSFAQPFFPIEASTSPSGSDMETPGPVRTSNPGSAVGLDGTMYGAYVEEPNPFRVRSPSMADSIISHMSSVDWNPRAHDPFAEDFSYVPCFTSDQARSVFRDTVLGLEYLHYQGVVHRDIKPANLLWTKDHRVKISDFGVSYFGRPIRDGEPDDETVSESEAQDFDDDLELAKTVGTPAFFAPELCYTDTDRIEQPKISEMIDIWSLGVTLYCLIFARIPFQAEDEWAMFKKIATEDVFIPRKRLRPVDPQTSPDGTSLYKRQNGPPYRDDNDLSYEEIDDDLYDLLKLMFTKNPDKRIRLRDIKRHRWVTQGITNPIAWIDDTDPGRNQGRRVQVDAKEAAHAVVQISLLERARSVVKKAAGKVMHSLTSERGDSKSRRRAASSVASTAGDSSTPNVSTTRDLRRKSIKPEDYFTGLNYTPHVGEHPLSQSVGASSMEAYDPLATAIAQPVRRKSQDASQTSEEALFGTITERPIPQRSGISLSANHFLALTEAIKSAKTTPTSPVVQAYMEGSERDLRRARGGPSQQDDLSRSQSVDRALFISNDKRAAPKVGMTTAAIPGTLHRAPSRPRPVKSIDLTKNQEYHQALASPLFFSSQAIKGYQHTQHQSDSNIYERQRPELDERPQTSHRVRDVPGAKTPPPRSHNLPTPENSILAKQALQRRRIEEYQQSMAKQVAASRSPSEVDPSEVPCPPSPGDEEHPRLSRQNTIHTSKSSRSTSGAGLTTPLTSPSDFASPVSSSNFPSKEQILAFQSDPSLPALLSGASSTSADAEADLPMEPAALGTRADMLQTTDSLTPPAFGKEPMSGFPLEHMEQQASSEEVISLHLDDSRYAGSISSSTPELRPVADEDEADDSDSSDEGLLMARSTRRKKCPPSSTDRTPFGAHRRDTNISIASTDTAKHYQPNGNEPAA
ncbi:serine/threonine-protein kinase ssp1 [Plectosphaerella plurivora]|uniref:non-specific serine/threonine protein kinase n=1 Tax=Plectosphaerella plurivora TaxID=936078 RepID=A0A9P9A660_9PEZI|nr:serine/threonine-protein kinase ssp1 [Plectosphaerella plurivora]